MSTRIKIIVSLVALAAVAVTVPLAAASRSNDSRLVIGIRLNFDSSTHAGGTFAACCAVNDDGAAEAQVLSFAPRGDNEATFEATNTYVGQKGSFSILLRGVTGPLDSDRHVARARWRVVDGSGAYAQLSGEGQLTAVTDETTGFLSGVAVGESHEREASRIALRGAPPDWGGAPCLQPSLLKTDRRRARCWRRVLGTGRRWELLRGAA